MKNLFLFAFAAFLLTGTVAAQTIVFNEDFESGPYEFTASGTPTWGINSRVHVSGSYSDSCYVGLSSTSYLTSNAFSTLGNSSVLLEFKQICKIEFFDAAQIEYSTDGGGTWTAIAATYYLGSGGYTSSKFTEQSYSADWQAGVAAVVPTNTWWKTEQFDLGAVLGNLASVIIRFKLSDGNNNGSNQRVGWFLDDIKVTIAPSELTPPTITQIPTIWQDTVYATGPFQVKAKISDLSGIDTAYVVYSLNGGLNDTIGMTVLAADTFSTFIPAQAYNMHIDYFIVAKDASAASNIGSTTTKWFYTKQPAPVVIIGTGTSTEYYLPCYGYYNYGWSAQVYTASEIGTSGIIDSLFFQIGNSVSNYIMTNQRMMIAIVADSTFASGVMPDSTSMTTFFAGNVTWNGTGWFKFIPTTSFYYSGLGHLLIYWINRDGSYSSGYPTFKYTATPVANKAKYVYSNTYSSVFPSSTGTLTTTRPNLKIAFQPSNTVHDAAAIQITEPFSSPIPIVGTPYNTKVKIRNIGSDTLTGITINWELNGIAQTPYAWTGMLLQDQISNEINIGSVTFINTGSNNIKVWTSNPDGFVDEQPLNDTTSKSYFACTSVLAGNYTIDPITPTGGTNFQGFTDAMNVLKNCGVSDTTVFQIASGIYDTLLSFPATIPGIGISAPVTFQSASGNASDVTLRNNAASTGNNYIIDINGAKFLAFRNMTFQSLSSTYGKCFSLRNNSNNILIEGNIIKGPVATSTSTDMALIHNYSASIDSNIVIINNTFTNGSYGVYMYGTNSTTLENGNLIEGNTFSNYYTSGLYAYYQKNLQIKKNILSTNTTYASTIGMSLNYCDYAQINKNKIVQPTYYGLYLNYSDGDATTQGAISNNFISVGGITTAYGIYAYYSNYFNFYHNSINCSSTSTTGGSSFYYYYANNCKINNNIFANTGGGYAFYSASTSLTSDYNNLFTTGTNLGYYNSANSADLSAWQTATSQDANSVSINPQFQSTTDLHTTLTALNDLGAPVGIIDDIDNQVRSLFSPDMGADEYTPAAEDAGVYAIIEPATSPAPVVGTPYNMTVKIKNYGTDTITKANIEWKLDGVAQTPFAFTGSLLPDSISSNIIVGTVTFPTAGTHNITVWTSLPNDSVDPNNINDTLSEAYFSCITVLSGTYTIDPLVPTGGTNFQYFADVIAQLNSCGISDTTIFEIASGTYDTLLTFSGAIPGNGLNASIVFQSSTGIATDVVLRDSATTSGSNYIVSLAGAKFMEFKNMTFLAQGLTYSRCVSIQGNSNNILFEGNIFTNPTVSISTSSDKALFYNVGSSNDSNIVIKNNTFNNGSYSLYMYGTSSTVLENGNVIENNNFNNYYFAGIYTYNQKNLRISENNLNSNTTYAYSTGLYLNYCDYSIIEKNKINNPTYYGLYLYYCDGDATTQGQIANNFISIGGGATAYGLYAYYSNYYNIYNNSVNCFSTSTIDGRSMYYYYSNNFNFRNNIFANNGGGYAFYSASTSLTSDYNNLFTTGTNLGYYNSANRTNLSAWVAATLKDSNSVSVYPSFFSNTDLHSISLALDNQGTPLASVTDDIDSDIRSLTTPDIGADEFAAPAQEAALLYGVTPSGGCSLGIEPISIAILNNGTDTINGNLTAYYVVNGQTPVSESVPNIIPSGDTAIFTFSTPVNMIVGAIDSLFHFTYYLELTGDPLQLNDTAHFNLISRHSPGTVSVTNATIPYATSTTLNATSADTIQWYADATLTTLLQTGSSFTTPVLFDTTIYYVASTSELEYNYTFDTDLQGWTATTPCVSYTTYNWTWASDAGAGTAYMEDPDYESSAALFSPVLSVFGDSIDLSFRHRYDTENCCDRGLVAYRIDGGSWTHFTPTTGVYPGTASLTIDPVLASCTYGPTVGTFGGTATTYFVSSGKIPLNGGTQLEIAFAFSSDGSVAGTGWYIDEVNLYKTGCPGPVVEDTVFITGTPPEDVGVIAIDDPNSGIDLSNHESVTVRVINFGTATQSNIPVNYSINGGAAVSEVIPGPINPGDTAIYTFTTSANLLAYNTYSFAAYTTLSSDNILINDTAYKSVTNSPLVYCTSAATYTADEDLGNVTFAGINNTSPSPHNGTYTNYSVSVAPGNIAPGGTYPISVTIVDDAASYYTGYCEVYIDYNQDGTFAEPGEVVFGGSYPALASATITGTVIVPSTVTIGNTRMRVVVTENGTASSVLPCGTYNYGETEDYTITIAPVLHNDAGVIAITEPDYIQSESSLIPVIVNVKNFGSDTIYSIPIEYTHNSNPVVTYTWTGTLFPDNTTSVTLPDLTVAAGLNDICVKTVLLLDSNTFNDEKCSQFYGLPPFTMFEDDIEDGTILYTDAPALWQHGKPTASVINTAHSPDSAWATILAGNYPNSASGFIYTPTMSFFGINDAYLTFYYWIHAQENLDGGYVQYSTNNGTTWASLGGINDPEGYNWFDSYASTTPGWTKNTGGWTPAFIKLDAVAGFSSVKFRFGFKSNSTTTYNGFAIDDIKILAPNVAIDAGIVDVITPTGTTQTGVQTSVQVRIKNFGTDTLNSIPLAYRLNTGYPPQNGTWTGTLLPDSTATFTFTQTYSGPAIDYTLCAYTLLSGDPYKTNDTTCVDLTLVGIEDMTQNGVVLMQNIPNPTSAQTEISFTLPEPGNCVITLRNTLGEQILSTQMSGQTGKNTFNFDASNLEQGIYFYTLEYKEVVLTRRLSVIR